jgi:DNA-directed RNA polymerase subunit RPC12/RpoP
MNGKTSEFRDKPACSTKYDLFPVMITCERCGHDTETWPDEDETVCRKCGDMIKVTVKG